MSDVELPVEWRSPDYGRHDMVRCASCARVFVATARRCLCPGCGGLRLRRVG